MAGRPIKRAYEAKIAEVGIEQMLSRVESGESIKDIAASLGMSRPFLSGFLNRDPLTADALCLARALAAQKRIASREREGDPGAERWIRKVHAAATGPVNAAAQFLEALKRIQSEIGSGKLSLGAKSGVSGEQATDDGRPHLGARPAMAEHGEDSLGLRTVLPQPRGTRT